MTSINRDSSQYANCRIVDADTVRHGGSEFVRRRTCTMVANDIKWTVEGEYTWACNVCDESTALLACVNEDGDVKYIKPKFCANCGSKVVS